MGVICEQVRDSISRVEEAFEYLSRIDPIELCAGDREKILALCAGMIQNIAMMKPCEQALDEWRERQNDMMSKDHQLQEWHLTPYRGDV